ncbi:Endonuclease/exonuclease/phosphatase [Chlamydoabsidia padenii]|nr:Endonuclease/exonuclease/phosphatase [Chlamydoabsidia padenii]
MTYNILAQILCQRFIHPTAGDILKWKTQRRMLIEEMTYYKPDLMCLQEVDNYDEFYKEALAKLGQHETKRHGCLIGYQSNAWNQIEYRTIDYDTDNSCKPTQATGNIGQLVALAFKEVESNGLGRSGVILGNTHSYWRPPSTYERCRQGLIYIHHLLNLQKELPGKDHWVPLMLGDFNTQPSDPFYSIILETTRRPSYNDEPSIDSSTTTDDLVDTHKLLDLLGPDEKMQSVYSRHKQLWDRHQQMTDHDAYNVGEPDYTNYAHVFKGTLDYLFIPLQAVILDILMLPLKDIIHPA